MQARQSTSESSGNSNESSISACSRHRDNSLVAHKTRCCGLLVTKGIRLYIAVDVLLTAALLALGFSWIFVGRLAAQIFFFLQGWIGLRDMQRTPVASTAGHLWRFRWFLWLLIAVEVLAVLGLAFAARRLCESSGSPAETDGCMDASMIAGGAIFIYAAFRFFVVVHLHELEHEARDFLKRDLRRRNSSSGRRRSELNFRASVNFSPTERERSRHEGTVIDPSVSRKGGMSAGDRDLSRGSGGSGSDPATGEIAAALKPSRSPADRSRMLGDSSPRIMGNRSPRGPAAALSLPPRRREVSEAPPVPPPSAEHLASYSNSAQSPLDHVSVNVSSQAYNPQPPLPMAELSPPPFSLKANPVALDEPLTSPPPPNPYEQPPPAFDASPRHQQPPLPPPSPRMAGRKVPEAPSNGNKNPPYPPFEATPRGRLELAGVGAGPDHV